jgi:hypothetical protein
LEGGRIGRAALGVAVPEENFDFLPMMLGVLDGDLPLLPLPFNSSTYELVDEVRPRDLLFPFLLDTLSLSESPFSLWA